MVCGGNIDKEPFRPVPRLKVDQPVIAAVAMMHRVNCEVVVVYDERGERIVGVFTPRDLVSLLAYGLDPGQITLGQWLAVSEPAEAREGKGECWLG